MTVAVKLGYKVVDQTGATSLIKSGPAGFFGFTVVTSTAATISVYDGTSASGTLIYSKTGLAVGDAPVQFGGNGFALGVGLFVVVGGTGSVSVLFT